MTSRPRLFTSLALAAAAVVAATILGRPHAWEATTTVTIAATPTLDARRVRFHRGTSAFDATVVRFDRTGVAARLVDVAEGQSLADVAGDATLTINAGYFDDAFAPLGLYRINGRDVSPMLARSPLSGVVTIDDAGRLDAVPRDAAGVASARSAFQSGPFLIDPGGADGIHADDAKIAERTVIAFDDRRLCVIVTSPATLFAVAAALGDRPEALGLARVERAINLDGGPSSGFVLNVDGQRRASLPRGRIRSTLTLRVGDAVRRQP